MPDSRLQAISGLDVPVDKLIQIGVGGSDAHKIARAIENVTSERHQRLSIKWDKSRKLIIVRLAGTELSRNVHLDGALPAKPKRRKTKKARTMVHKEFIGSYRPDGHDDSRVTGFKKVNFDGDGNKKDGDETIKLGVCLCSLHTLLVAVLLSSAAQSASLSAA